MKTHAVNAYIVQNNLRTKRAKDACYANSICCPMKWMYRPNECGYSIFMTMFIVYQLMWIFVSYTVLKTTQYTIITL